MSVRRKIANLADNYPKFRRSLLASLDLHGEVSPSHLIHLAYRNAALRPHLIPLIKLAIQQPGKKKDEAAHGFLVWSGDSVDKYGGARKQSHPTLGVSSLPRNWYVPPKALKARLKRIKNKERRKELKEAQKAGVEAIQKKYQNWFRRNWKGPRKVQIETIKRVLTESADLPRGKGLDVKDRRKILKYLKKLERSVKQKKWEAKRVQERKQEREEWAARRLEIEEEKRQMQEAYKQKLMDEGRWPGQEEEEEEEVSPPEAPPAPSTDNLITRTTRENHIAKRINKDYKGGRGADRHILITEKATADLLGVPMFKEVKLRELSEEKLNALYEHKVGRPVPQKTKRVKPTGPKSEQPQTKAQAAGTIREGIEKAGIDTRGMTLGVDVYRSWADYEAGNIGGKNGILTSALKTVKPGRVYHVKAWGAGHQPSYEDANTIANVIIELPQKRSAEMVFDSAMGTYRPKVSLAEAVEELGGKDVKTLRDTLQSTFVSLKGKIDSKDSLESLHIEVGSLLSALMQIQNMLEAEESGAKGGPNYQSAVRWLKDAPSFGVKVVDFLGLGLREIKYLWNHAKAMQANLSAQGAALLPLGREGLMNTLTKTFDSLVRAGGFEALTDGLSNLWAGIENFRSGGSPDLMLDAGDFSFDPREENLREEDLEEISNWAGDKLGEVDALEKEPAPEMEEFTLGSEDYLKPQEVYAQIEQGDTVTVDGVVFTATDVRPGRVQMQDSEGTRHSLFFDEEAKEIEIMGPAGSMDVSDLSLSRMQEKKAPPKVKEAPQVGGAGMGDGSLEKAQEEAEAFKIRAAEKVQVLKKDLETHETEVNDKFVESYTYANLEPPEQEKIEKEVFNYTKEQYSNLAGSLVGFVNSGVLPESVVSMVMGKGPSLNTERFVPVEVEATGLKGVLAGMDTAMLTAEKALEQWHSIERIREERFEARQHLINAGGDASNPAQLVKILSLEASKYEGQVARAAFDVVKKVEDQMLYEMEDTVLYEALDHLLNVFMEEGLEGLADRVDSLNHKSPKVLKETKKFLLFAEKRSEALDEEGYSEEEVQDMVGDILYEYVTSKNPGEVDSAGQVTDLLDAASEWSWEEERADSDDPETRYNGFMEVDYNDVRDRVVREGTKTIFVIGGALYRAFMDLKGEGFEDEEDEKGFAQFVTQAKPLANEVLKAIKTFEGLANQLDNSASMMYRTVADDRSGSILGVDTEKLFYGADERAVDLPETNTIEGWMGDIIAQPEEYVPEYTQPSLF